MKYAQVKVNFTPDHFNQLVNLAAAADITIAQYIREQLNLQIGEKPRIRKKRTKAVQYKYMDPQLLYHLAKIGNNLNQIAKKLNQGTIFDRLGLATLLEIRERINDYQH